MEANSKHRSTQWTTIISMTIKSFIMIMIVCQATVAIKIKNFGSDQMNEAETIDRNGHGLNGIGTREVIQSKPKIVR